MSTRETMLGFDDLIGQNNIKKLLLQMADSPSMPHAFLFHGPQGVGKCSFAEGFAQLITTCQTKTSSKDHPDIRKYRLETPSDMHSITTMRELKEETKIPPLEASRRVFIIEDAHKMLATSSNALLKTLEEPASGAVIILLAPSIGELLPTVVSRCCKIAFPPLRKGDITQILMKKLNLVQDQAETLANYSFGSLDRVLLDMNEDTKLWEEDLLEILTTFKGSSFEVMQQKLAALEEKVSKDSFEKVYEIILYFIKDLVLLQQGLSPSLLSFKKHEQALRNSAAQIKLSSHEMQTICYRTQESHAYHTKLKSALEALLLCFYQE